MLSQSFLDPIWLLITAPSVIYAAALILSFFNILVLSKASNGLRSQALLTFLVFIEICIFKLQVAHSLLLVFMYLALERLLVHKSKNQVAFRFTILTSIVVLLSISQLVLYPLLNSGREDYFKDFVSFLLTIPNMTVFATAGITLYNRPALLSLASATFGFILLLGPLLSISALISLRPGLNKSSRLEHKLIILTLLSYLFGILLNPVAPWDSTEFQNRTWPVLWCIGLWFLSGASSTIPNYVSAKSSRIVMVLNIVLIIILLPPAKTIFIGRPLFANDWTKNYYPLSIKSSDKQLAVELKQHAKESNSIIYIQNGSDGKLNDQTSIVSTLNGISPFLSRKKFMDTLSKSNDSAGDNRWEEEASRVNNDIRNKCATLTGARRIVLISKYSLPTREDSTIVSPCKQ